MRMKGFLRMSLWARRPPSEAKVRFFFAILGLCLAIFAVEWLFGWPDWLTPHFTPRGRIGG